MQMETAFVLCIAVDNLPIQEDQRVERLILSRGRDPAVHGEMREKLRNFCGIHFSRVPLPVIQNKPPDPTAIGSFGSQAQMPETRFVTYPIEEFPLTHSSGILPRIRYYVAVLMDT